MNINGNERIDRVNDNLSLIQNKDGLTFGTDALLLAAYVSKSYKTGVEIGSGSGIISMLILSRGKCKEIDALEVQEEYARLTERNAALNSLSERLRAVFCDAREYRREKECELVFTNPPYMKASSGKMNENSKKTVARHEIMGDIFDFCNTASRLLKYGGDFYCVYRPDRMSDLFYAMRKSQLEPKLLTAVYANQKSEPSMILVMAKKNAAPMMKFTRPLIIYTDETNKTYTSDMNYIMENGSFPTDFIK